MWLHRAGVYCFGRKNSEFWITHVHIRASFTHISRPCCECLFLQCVKVAFYAERCTSYGKSVCLSVQPSICLSDRCKNVEFEIKKNVKNVKKMRQE